MSRIIFVLVLVSLLATLLAPVCFAGNPGGNNGQSNGLPAWVSKAQAKVKVVSKNFTPLKSGASAPLQATYDWTYNNLVRPNSNTGRPQGR